jgi:hypothetical protein
MTGIRAQWTGFLQGQLMVAQRAVGKRRGHPFKGRHADLADRPPKGVVIFTSICVVILLAFYGYLAWYLLTSSLASL